MLKRLIVTASLLFFAVMTPQAEAQNYFGAIAVASNGAYGYSYDMGSRGSAENGALRECRKRGRGCSVAVWFRNACGALAMGNNGAWATAWGNPRSYAEQLAMQGCNRRAGGCYIRQWVCTTR